MGLFASRRNFGFGKMISWAGNQALTSYYGNGHFGTVSTHRSHWEQFCVWLKVDRDVNDARLVTQEMLESYASYLVECVDDAVFTVDYAQNLLSGANVTLEAMRGDSSVRIDSPSQRVGKRCAVRTDPPSGYDWARVDSAIAGLNEAGYPRAAVVLEEARTFGVRLREAVLGDIRQWQRQATIKNEIDIRLGTKGGRGHEVERWVPVSARGAQVLDHAAAVRDQLGCGTNLLRPTESFEDLVINGEINAARKILHKFGIKGYHDMRAAWACDGYKALTGCEAPVINPHSGIDPIKDREAREVLARQLGHGRIGILVSYIGALPKIARSTKVPMVGGLQESERNPSMKMEEFR